MNNGLSHIRFPEEFYPAQVFFNRIFRMESGARFLWCLEAMLNGIGIGFDGCGCYVPNDDEDDDFSPETGMSFYVGYPDEIEKWISNEQVKEFYKIVIEVYCKDHPEYSDNARRILDMACSKL